MKVFIAVAICYLSLSLSFPLLCSADETAAPKVEAEKENSREKWTSAIGKNLPDFERSASEVFKALLYCVAAVLLIGSVYRRVKPEVKVKAPKELEIVAKQELGPKTSLLLVKTDGEKFLLAHSNEELKLITTIKDHKSSGSKEDKEDKKSGKPGPEILSLEKAKIIDGKAIQGK